MKAKYPLEALGAVRERRVEAQEHELAERVRALAKAEQLESQARERCLAAAQTAEGVEHDERERLAAGGVHVGEIAQAADFQAGEQARIAQLARDEAQARDEAAAERERARLAKSELAHADADAQAVESHREAWQARETARAELAEEEAMVEQWTAKRHPPRGG